MASCLARVLVKFPPGSFRLFSAGIPPPPTTCCMSGCANCVWIEYAELLLSKYENCSDKVTKDILDQIEDPSLKAFLQMELEFKLKK